MEVNFGKCGKLFKQSSQKKVERFKFPMELSESWQISSILELTLILFACKGPHLNFSHFISDIEPDNVSSWWIMSGSLLCHAIWTRKKKGLAWDKKQHPDPGDAGVWERVPGAPPSLGDASLHSCRGQLEITHQSVRFNRYMAILVAMYPLM